MKFKYYLRGAGVGILVSTLIFIIALAFHSPELSDEQIEARAREMGMDYTEESGKSKAKENEDKNTEADAEKKDAKAEDGTKAEDDAKVQGDAKAEDDAKVQGDTKAEDDNKAEGSNKAKEKTDTVETVSFTIASGESSSAVAKHLQEYGLVDSGEAFDLFLSDQNLDNNLLPGTYSIKKGSTFLEIADVLTTKK